jgi:hypothetical protein
MEVIKKYQLGKTTLVKLSDGQEISVSFEDLKEEKILGRSQSTVSLMRHKPTEKKFAVKVC